MLPIFAIKWILDFSGDVFFLIIKEDAEITERPFVSILDPLSALITECLSIIENSNRSNAINIIKNQTACNGWALANLQKSISDSCYAAFAGS